MSAWTDRIFATAWAASFGHRRQRAARALWLGRFCRTVGPGSGLRLRLRWCRWHDHGVVVVPAGQLEQRRLTQSDRTAPAK